MMKDEPALETLREAVNIICDFPITRNSQKIEKIIPIILYLLQDKIASIESYAKSEVYYIPLWVDSLLKRIDNDTTPLSEEEYAVFKTRTQYLSFDDFKASRNGLLGYIPKVMSCQDIKSLIHCLKSYFDFI